MLTLSTAPIARSGLASFFFFPPSPPHPTGRPEVYAALQDADTIDVPGESAPNWQVLHACERSGFLRVWYRVDFWISPAQLLGKMSHPYCGVRRAREALGNICIHR